MGTDPVVVSAPSLQLTPGIVKAHEPMRVQALRPELAVEAFDEGVIGRFAGTGKIQDDILLVGLLILE